MRLNLKAHSGSTMYLHDDEEALLKKTGWDANTRLFGEVSVGFPDIRTQLDVARREYDDPGKVGLIMLSAGITDIAVANILNIFGDEKWFRAQVPKYCEETISRLLDEAASSFPNALIALVGYYPIISKKTPVRAMFDAVMEVYGFPRVVKPVLNNPLTYPILRRMRGQVIARSRFLGGELRGGPSAFGRSPQRRGGSPTRCLRQITGHARDLLRNEKDAALADGEEGRAEDPQYNARREACGEAYRKIGTTKMADYSVRACELSGLGHPNVEGANAYAAAIRDAVGPLLRERGD